MLAWKGPIEIGSSSPGHSWSWTNERRKRKPRSKPILSGFPGSSLVTENRTPLFGTPLLQPSPRTRCRRPFGSAMACSGRTDARRDRRTWHPIHPSAMAGARKAGPIRRGWTVTSARVRRQPLATPARQDRLASVASAVRNPAHSDPDEAASANQNSVASAFPRRSAAWRRLIPADRHLTRGEMRLG